LVYGGVALLTDDDRQWIKDEIKTGMEQLVVRLEQVETSLFTAFHRWATPVQMRQRSHSAALKALDAEVEAVGDRVQKLEGEQ